MIYEMRIYRCVPGRLPALLQRFQNVTLKIWDKHGIKQAGFWTTLIGESNQKCIDAGEHARICETIPYEILCSISKRVPRIYA